MSQLALLPLLALDSAKFGPTFFLLVPMWHFGLQCSWECFGQHLPRLSLSRPDELWGLLEVREGEGNCVLSAGHSAWQNPGDLGKNLQWMKYCTYTLASQEPLVFLGKQMLKLPDGILVLCSATVANLIIRLWGSHGAQEIWW